MCSCMSDQLLSMYGLAETEQMDDSVPFATLPTRVQVLQRIIENRNFDLLILGGGLTGAVLAHEAALRGISVLLLEREYLGRDALSWDLRIAHQLRKKPSELLRARAALQGLIGERAQHLTAPLPKDSHTVPGVTARWVRRLVPLVNVDERLLIRETILAARQEGAIVLTAVTPRFVEAESATSGCYVVGFEDTFTHTVYEARVGGIVLDPTHGVLPPSRLGTYVVPATDPQAAGVQLVFEAAPRSAKSGCSFVSFELTDGSFVAVKRRGVSLLEVTLLWGATPLAADQAQAAVEDAARESGWVLGREVSQRPVSGRWAKRYGISQVKGVFTCHHRGAWDAFRSAQTIVKALVALSPEPRTERRSPDRPLPGAERHCEVDAFRALARAQGVSEYTIERAVARWRGRVRYLAHFANGLHECAPGILRGEIELAVVSDQVCTVEDIACGGLELQHNPEWRTLLPMLSDRLNAFYEAQPLAKTP